MHDRVGPAGSRTGKAVGWSARSSLFLFLAIAWVMSQGRSARAQTAVEGAMRGVVSDGTRAVVAGATLHLEEVRRSLVFEAVCDAQGSYVFA
ncbi:MAG TPA: hypothetical protein VK593_08490, partial [Edaphobacter sp.]|nr:hypothetical protein [Edaphobacter sp.]